MSSGNIMHDGNFGADWVNITLGDRRIAQVAYQGDGTQRQNVERIVKTWNEYDALVAQTQVRIEAVSALADELEFVVRTVRAGMTTEEVAALVKRIDIVADAVAEKIRGQL